MKRFICSIIAAALTPLFAAAQINTYFPDTWKDKPQPETVGPQQAPYFITDYKIVRDFNTSARDKADAVSHYRSVYKKVHINTQAGADSLTQLVLTLETDEALRGFRIRVIAPDGSSSNLTDQTRTLKLNDGRQAIVVNGFRTQAGFDLEYELSLKVQYNYAGSEITQSAIATAAADFMLVAPKDLRFRFSSVNGAPAVQDSISGNSRIHRLHSTQIPALLPNDLFYYLPQLQRVDFSMESAISGRDTTRLTWQRFAEENYIPFVAVSKAEFKQLEKELDRWPFLKQRRQESQLIYLIEQYIKSNYKLVSPAEFFEQPDLTTIIRRKQTDNVGMVRLMNAVYYMLGIPVNILFTSTRDTVPLNENLVNQAAAKNVLLYFPTQQQALAPTEMTTRYPCYPALWTSIPALRCRDTLIGTENKVLTSFITTPVPPYTLSSSTLEATLADVTNPVWQVTQSYGGYAATNIKSAFGKATTEELRSGIFNALLPFAPGMRKPVSVQAQNETFTPAPLDKPVVITSTLQTPSTVVQDGNTITIETGPLLTGKQDYQLEMPDNPYPVEIAFPYYQERRLHIDLPAGYTLANKADFTVDISRTEGAKPVMGLKMRSEQENNRLHIYTIEWYSQPVFTGAAKETFGQMLEQLKRSKQLRLVLKKQ
ncbi:hypothetical protein ECE50_015105 [Chitinophaga sp. Mgbs1]|uniref:DUF3857 domain-containing protein n=1 Tax=Chitinophaga solisilvae TaxID=1233460 RepID=A0A9Q5DBB6_9BACT|nr:hypothetical protein [Chitinophaga solisilvae]